MPTDDTSGSIIKRESENDESLSLYEGVKESDLVGEEIDERILKLLGIEDVFDIDYQTYITLLKERIVASQLSDKKKLSTEESMLLSDEVKRVKSKVGRFKVKKKKISTDSFFKPKELLKVSKDQYYLTSKAIIPDAGTSSNVRVEGKKTLLDYVISINSTLENILENIKIQNGLIKKDQELQRKKTEDSRRNIKESLLEKGSSGIKKLTAIASKLLTPIQDILDKIGRFIFFTLLGRAFTSLVKWFRNPKNKERVETLMRFLKDWFPAILGAYILFGTRLGKFIRTITGAVIRLSTTLAKRVIPFLIKHPLVAIGLATGAAASIGFMTEKKRLEDTQKQRGEKPEKRGQGNLLNEIGKAFNPGQLGSSGMSGFRNGGIVTPSENKGTTIIPASNIAFEGGGMIDESTGMEITGAGPDTQLIAAKPGEIVIPTETVDKYGSSFFMNLIRGSGKSGVPKTVNNIQLAKDGGMVGGEKPTGGFMNMALNLLKNDEALSSLTKGSNDYIKPTMKTSVYGRKWNSIKPSTKIYSYLDNYNTPTIGWGSTFYDRIANGKKPVKMGDVITKKKADDIFQNNVSLLAKLYASKIPLWYKMTDAQKAGLLLFGYNAPNGPIGSYENLTSAVMRGDMSRAVEETRDIQGPNMDRQNLVRKLLKQGPLNLKAAPEPPIKPRPSSTSSGSRTPQTRTSTSGSRPTNKGNPLIDWTKNIKIPGITPLPRNNRASVINLPDIKQSAMANNGPTASTGVPRIYGDSSPTLEINAALYGIV